MIHYHFNSSEGSNIADFQYAGYYCHATLGLNLTKYRAYDPVTSRWLSRDPINDPEITTGPNLYWYVSNDPIADYDPLGLSAGSTHPKCDKCRCEDRGGKWIPRWQCEGLSQVPPAPIPGWMSTAITGLAGFVTILFATKVGFGPNASKLAGICGAATSKFVADTLNENETTNVCCMLY